MKRRDLLTLLILGSAATSVAFGQAPAVPAAPQTWAVVVGVDNYQLTSINPLRYAGADAKLLVTSLRSSMKLPENNTFLFTNDSKDESQKPTLPNIIFRLDWLEKHVASNDTLVFYFAGHGMTMENEIYLLTEDSDNRSKGTLDTTALLGKTLYDQLSRIPVANTLVMLDACRNDPLRGRGEAPNPLSENAVRSLQFSPVAAPAGPSARPAQRNQATIFACSVGQRSWEWNDRKHGFFTYQLVEGMSKAANSQGYITLATLSNYVQKAVVESTTRNASEVQTPIIRYDGPGLDSWVLSKTGITPPVGSNPAGAKVRVRGPNATTKTKAGDLVPTQEPDDPNF